MADRFAGLNAQERYKREYRECRMFDTYVWPRQDRFYIEVGDGARLNAYLSWVYRKAAENADYLEKRLSD